MRVSRIYDEQPLNTGDSITLSTEASYHLSKVLRAKPDQMIAVFNGDGHEYLGRIDTIDRKKVTLVLEDSHPVNNESPLKIHLAQAVSKGDRMDYVIQKAVELGASTITPIQTERGNVKLDKERSDKKVEHWQKVAISAAEQSGRAVITTVNPIIKLADWLKEEREGLKVVLHHRNTKPLSQIDSPNSVITMFVGPEGGLSDTEITNCQLQGFQPFALGPRVLRTETAPLAAISVLQSMWGDLS